MAIMAPTAAPRAVAPANEAFPRSTLLQPAILAQAATCVTVFTPPITLLASEVMALAVWTSWLSFQTVAARTPNTTLVTASTVFAAAILALPIGLTLEKTRSEEPYGILFRLRVAPCREAALNALLFAITE